MAIVYLGLGSNLRAEENLRLAVRELRAIFDLLLISPVYRSKALGFTGCDFLNAVVCVETNMSPVAICEQLERIHGLAGRARGDRRFESRTLDIDLLLYDDLVDETPPVAVPRSDILHYSFVLRPLADIAPDLVHPLCGKTMSSLWDEFDAASHPLQDGGIIL